MDRWRALRTFGVNAPPPADPAPPPPPPPLELPNSAGDGVVAKTQQQQQPPPPPPPRENGASRPLPVAGTGTARKVPSLHPDSKGDYVDVASRPHLMKILSKHGELKILFADKVLKITGSGKMKRCILLITDVSIYLVDPDTDTLKRRIVLVAVEKLCLSKLNDNFFAIILHKEYDCLMASTRKMEIIEAVRNTSRDELEISLSNSFEYRPASNVVKEVQFQEVEGGIKTRILKVDR